MSLPPPSPLPSGLQGKAEQMMPYITRLRTCIRGFQQREALLLSNKGALRHEVAHQEKSHMATGETSACSHADTAGFNASSSATCLSSDRLKTRVRKEGCRKGLRRIQEGGGHVGYTLTFVLRFATMEVLFRHQSSTTHR